MVKKLPLSEFIAKLDYPSFEEAIVKKISYTPIQEFSSGISLKELYSFVATHAGPYIVNGVEYSSVLESSTNLYFYNNEGGKDDEYMILFDPIIDIKLRDGIYELYSYPDTVTTIFLGNNNGPQIANDEGKSL